MYMVYTQSTQGLPLAVRAISQGRVVAFPTGTAYGLAVDALQGHALQRLRNLKQRPQEKTFSVFVNETLWEKFLQLTAEENALLRRLSGQPLTLLVKPKPPLTHLSQHGLVGLRVIDHPLMRGLAAAVRAPLTATSANVSGQDPCFTPACLRRQFPGKIDATTYDLSLAVILDAGELPKSPPSTIAKLVNGQVAILREGAISASAINDKL